ncbi:MAG TPA: hypothetical protein VGG10_15060 [Rhizomicrobium sp.]|jgi:hypothetical protein
MTKICIIGDSHTGALFKGWRLISAEFRDLDLTFFAGPRNGYAEVVVKEKSRLVTSSAALRKGWRISSGQTNFIPNTFNAYVVSSLGLSFGPFLLHWEAKRPVRNLSAFADKVVRRTLTFQTISLLRQITDAPILFLGSPLPPTEHYSIEMGTADAQTYQDAFKTACRQIGTELNAEFLEQPPETVAENLVTTDMRYFSGVEGDRFHMNKDYGAITMRAVFSMLSTRV